MELPAVEADDAVDDAELEELMGAPMLKLPVVSNTSVISL